MRVCKRPDRRAHVAAQRAIGAMRQAAYQCFLSSVGCCDGSCRPPSLLPSVSRPLPHSEALMLHPP